MKTIIIIFIIAFFLGCSDGVVSRRIIPERNAQRAEKFIIEQLNTIKLTNRYEDEDFDDFLLQAKNNALELYGTDTLGIWEKSKSTFFPYALCTKENQTKLDSYYKK